MRSTVASSLLAAIVAPALLLQGCGNAGPTPDPSDDSRSSTTTATTTTTTPTSTTSTTTLPGWGCESKRAMKHAIAVPEKKGFAVDDETVTGCSDEMFEVWPHSSNEGVKSLRLFAAWTADWPEEDREPYWKNLKDFVQRNDAKVLLGTGVHCETAYDQQHWDWTMELMKLLGKKHIMGVAFGNEMDNMESCNSAFAQEGKFLDLIKPHVDAMDAAGFEEVPITVVWTMGALARGGGFNPLIMPFLADAQKAWGDRWVWTFNPYPIWDKDVAPHSPSECKSKIETAAGLDFTKDVMSDARKRVTEVTKNPDSTIWVGEAGWSSPGVDTTEQKSILAVCPSWASQETFFRYYESMMAWDLSLDDGGKPIDHLFYFTMRDSVRDGVSAESFGLVEKCGTKTCKVQAQEEMLVV